MSLFVKYYFLSIFFIFLTLNAGAQDFWRLRYFLPSSSETEIVRESKKDKVKLNTYGNSGNLIFANGVGLGYNTLYKHGTWEGVYYKFKNHSLDLSYTLGNTLSFTFGAGRIINGEGELTYNGKNFVTERSIGESFFLDLGLPFLGGEFIIRFRQNFTKFNNFQTQIDEESIVLEDSVKLISREVDAGLGFLF